MNKRPVKGPSAAIITAVDHLGNLLKNLPRNLPVPNSISEAKYQFYLDEGDIKEEGLYYALNRRLEICFKTHKNPEIRSKSMAITCKTS